MSPQLEEAEQQKPDMETKQMRPSDSGLDSIAEERGAQREVTTSQSMREPERPESASPFEAVASQSMKEDDLGRLDSQGRAQGRWRKAIRSVSLGGKLSSSFATLRDQHGLNMISPAELKTIQKLGEGSFAVVEQCLYTPTDGSPPRMVAVKKLKPEIVSHDDDLRSFMAEVSLMRKLKHRNIVQYVGIGHTDNSSDAKQNSSMYLVTELVEGGTLKQLVMKQMTKPHKSMYSDADALRWCINIAEALAYLHSVLPMVIHRDLKLENILLTKPEGKGADGTGAGTSCQEAKLADFGLVAFVQKKEEKSRASKAMRAASMALSSTVGQEPVAASQGAADVEQKRWTCNSRKLIDQMATGLSPPDSDPFNLAQGAKALSGRTGTFMYMAPEMFWGSGYTEKVDVFSFAIVMYELLHKYMMVFAVSNKGTEEEIERYAERVAGGWRPPVSDRFPAAVLRIITDAWAQDAEARPSMKEIAARLKKVQAEGLLATMAAAPGCACIIS